jgi:hypothetical protein
MFWICLCVLIMILVCRVRLIYIYVWFNFVYSFVQLCYTKLCSKVRWLLWFMMWVAPPAHLLYKLTNYLCMFIKSTTYPSLVSVCLLNLQLTHQILQIWGITKSFSRYCSVYMRQYNAHKQNCIIRTSGSHPGIGIALEFLKGRGVAQWRCGSWYRRCIVHQNRGLPSVCSGNQFCDRDEGIEIIEKADLNLSSDSLTFLLDYALLHIYSH